MVKQISRLRWVDIFKGLLIFMMVFAHTPTFCVKYIYAFHMAAFFFISGYTSNYDKDNLVLYIIKKFKSLMVPFFLVNLFFVILILSLKVFGIYNLYYDPGYTFQSIINVFKYLNNSDLGGTTWFLIVLFSSTIGLKILNDIVNIKFKKNHDEIKLLITAVLFIIANYFYYVNKESLQFFIDLIPMAMFFIETGNYIKNREIDIKKYKKLCVIAFLFLLVCYIYFTKFRYTHVEWPSRSFPNIIKLILMSYSGITILFVISKMIEKIANKKIKKVVGIIEYLGKNTLPIMLYHFLGFRIFFTILYAIHYSPKSQLKSLIPLYNNLGLCLLTTIFAIVFSLIVEFLINTVKKSVFKKKMI